MKKGDKKVNIIRTKAVELSTIPAIAYKQKLASGGSGIKILRMDMDKHAVCTIDKRTGEPREYGKIDETYFPMEAFDEAIELTIGLPYSSRGKIKLSVFESAEPEDIHELENNDIDVDIAEKVDIEQEYNAIVGRYVDEKGKINYQLMNKDFIQFAAKSKVVSDMVANKSLAEDILVFIIKNRAAFIANKKDNLDDNAVKVLIETLDEIDPRSAFKELKLYINRLLSKKSGR